MVMSQSTYTFLACFSGFWLVWALVVMLCCFCNFLQRRLKRHHEEHHHVGEERRCEGKELCNEGDERCCNERLREQCPEMEPLGSGHPAPPPPLLPPPLPPLLLSPPAAAAAAPSSPPQLLPGLLPPFCTTQMVPPIPLPIPHPMPQATCVSMPDVDLLREPPCYEEAVLMEDPPPPYSEVLADLGGGAYLKPAPVRAMASHPPLLRVDHHEPTETGKPLLMLPDRGYSSLIRLPSSQRWDLLGHHLSHGDMDLNHSHLTPSGPYSLQTGAIMATMPRIETRTPRQEVLGLHGGFYRLQGSAGVVPGNRQGSAGGVPGNRQGSGGGVPEIQGTLQGFQGRLHRIGGVQGPSYSLPTVFPLLGRCTAV